MSPSDATRRTRASSNTWSSSTGSSFNAALFNPLPASPQGEEQEVVIAPFPTVGDARALTSHDTWDAVVVGAGVTGAALACLLAKVGRRTLLLDRAAFPRDKVCGCCLSAAAISMMTQLGLSDALNAASPRPLRRVEMYLAASHLTLPHGGVAVSRSALDASLAGRAREEGAVFLDQTAASLGPMTDGFREIQLHNHGAQQTVRARIVFACDGLAGRLLDAEPGMAWTVAPHSRMGVHALLPADAMDIPADAIVMRAGRGGYVGLVRLEDGRIDLAAALDPAKCRAVGGPLALVRQILRLCGEATPLADVVMHGTPLLTRHRRVLGGNRVLAVGDACGYVEPFTGEGMKWGIASAGAVAELLSGSDDLWNEALPQRWRSVHDKMLAGPMRLCRVLTWALRRPQTLGMGLGAMRILPGLARRLSDAVNAPLTIPAVRAS